MRIFPIAAALVLATTSPANSQSVPEGIHAFAQGSSEMCGLIGANAADLIAKARQSADLRPLPIVSDRFEMFESIEPTKFQLVVTLSSEPAFPAASCREMYEEGGAWRMKRSMRCDASRDACDALFLEFQVLDADMTRAIQEEAN